MTLTTMKTATYKIEEIILVGILENRPEEDSQSGGLLPENSREDYTGTAEGYLRWGSSVRALVSWKPAEVRQR